MEKKKIAITGASGFIASQIQRRWAGENFVFFKLNRNASDAEWTAVLCQCDIVINLAGAPVFQRWNAKNKNQIFESRIQTTSRLVRLIDHLEEDQQPQLFISGSAIGYYPNETEELFDEYSNKAGNNFLSEVVQKWEAEAQKLKASKMRLVIARIGVVLGNEGGIIKTMKPIFKLGLGGKIASGRQAISFIHIEDLVNAFRFFIDQEETMGTYNLVSPSHTSNLGFTKAFGKTLKRPVIFPIPAFVLKIIYGQSSEIMIKGEKVYPKRLLEAGFKFQYPKISEALKHSI